MRQRQKMLLVSCDYSLHVTHSCSVSLPVAACLFGTQTLASELADGQEKRLLNNGDQLAQYAMLKVQRAYETLYRVGERAFESS